MGIKKTEFARKVDTNGRVIIPSDLRDELDIRPGDLLDFCIYEHQDGRTFLAFECARAESEISRARRILREAGIKFEEPVSGS